jgi:hypothetical protein
VSLPSTLNDREFGAYREPTGRTGEAALAVVGPDGSPAGVVGAANVGTGQVSVDTTSGGVTVAAARGTRRQLTIVNHGTTDVYVGVGSVTTSSGILLPGVKGAALTIDTTLAVKAIVASGSQSVSYLEEYD